MSFPTAPTLTRGEAANHGLHPVSDPHLTRTMPARIDAEELREWLQRADRPRIIDVRSAAEYRAAHIPSSSNVPLPLLREHLDQLAGPLDEQVVLICRTGRRAEEAEQSLAAAGLSRLHVLGGGIVAWQQINAPIVRGESRWDLERQVRLVAGSIVGTSILASTKVAPLKWVAAGIGAGLVTAALTDSCAMGALLAKLPYNRDLEPSIDEVLSSLRHQD
ncbi:Thiosulfate sulfurtransferase GlpE [Austwickia sp. TVS 96-490-7B]|uniref:rhodanese-like domain-containing protein n=1 Tax=Austwickia sp. TVS 96-490-7B TaxID=2830843 RepID=UPI001C577BFF|nr:rhodanese-like domain-containing protein [Austwickia sp. TVS 96-490-7B]MBW3087067.1 Thiosulfate sulfurtransferase GlpE [Austwickia sp. TVS 96-490-7B]